MEEVIKEALGTQTLTRLGVGGSGCINKGEGYQTDQGKVFIKENSAKGARQMFDGEFESLKALHSTQTVKVPQPVKVIDKPGGGALLVAEFMDMGHGLSKFSALLGKQLARLHLHNSEVGELQKKQESSVHVSHQVEHIDKFGFHVPTCCGYIPQENTWNEDWIKFYAQKIEYQVKKVEEDHGDREVRELWSLALIKVPSLFKNVEVKPALLHGDLWGGNAAETTTEPVIFDPASFYGHSEYDLAIARMFGGFSESFYSGYFNILPMAPGYRKRLSLYKFFHYINHWNHFGDGYRSSAIQTLQSVLH
ncbi:ketosamine-3-kinase-like [Liolophura sinensis]|uniref:ketosamine-3-kinase-like n=1 Tax=Liolophura sinensis TaxID=3198878 RepID=UPI0031591E4A